MNKILRVKRGVVMGLFMGIAVVAGGCVAAPPAGGGTSGGNIVQFAGGGEGERGQTQMFELKGAKIIAAAGLPEGEPDSVGLYQRREDSSIFLGTGEVEMTAVIEKGSDKPKISATTNGPTVEVVVNRKTAIYKDVTEISMEAQRDGLEVEQVVEQFDSLDQLLEEVSTNDTLSVWGQKSGDRIIASVIVFRPFALPMPANPTGQ